MPGKTAAFVIVVFAAISVSFAQSPPAIGSNFENQYVGMTILPGWTVDASSPPLVKLRHGNYVLTIDPIHTHARAFGSLEDIASVLPSVEAVMREVDGPWMTSCAQPGKMIGTSRIRLWPLYTDDTKSNVDYGCKFPSDGKPAWFGSYAMGAGPESEYIIALAYDTNDVNALPKKDSPELRQVLSDVERMMKTCELKPPIVITSIEPQTAAPGATVTLYGSGFALKNFDLEPRFVVLPDMTMAPPVVAADGKSMSFRIPPSKRIESCDRPGYVDIGGNCVPVLPERVGIIECPRVNDRHPTFCGVPFPPGAYQIQVAGTMVRSNDVTLTVTAKPAPVSISLLYPNVGVLPGDTIRVSGKGFTATGNTVTIGSAVVSNVPSPDGLTLEFEAPPSAGDSLIRGQYYFEASVANEKGKSNAITFGYSNADGLSWQKVPSSR
ncbi:MAG: hypothetical protein WAL85_20975 [Candidatus Korobacteraceae bacterium]